MEIVVDNQGVDSNIDAALDIAATRRYKSSKTFKNRSYAVPLTASKLNNHPRRLAKAQERFPTFVARAPMKAEEVPNQSNGVKRMNNGNGSLHGSPAKRNKLSSPERHQPVAGSSRHSNGHDEMQISRKLKAQALKPQREKLPVWQGRPVRSC